MAAHPGDAGKRKKPSAASKVVARFAGSGMAGILEIFIFHPVDTISKRLQTNQAKWPKNQAERLEMVKQVVFRDSYNKDWLARYKSLFPGFGFATMYKVSQRIYRFGGQPFVKDFLVHKHGDLFKRVFGEKRAQQWAHATAGAVVGVGEVVLVPLDTMKVKNQTNPQALKGRTSYQIVRSEGIRGLYRGSAWTALRNAPGSFTLFGVSAVVKEGVFGNEDYHNATPFQIFVAAIAGSLACIVVGAPFDTVKTRVQNRPFDKPETGLSVIRNMLREEGVTAFFKGLTPKMIMAGPKLVFAMTAAEMFIRECQRQLDSWDLFTVAAASAAAPTALANSRAASGES